MTNRHSMCGWPIITYTVLKVLGMRLHCTNTGPKTCLGKCGSWRRLLWQASGSLNCASQTCLLACVVSPRSFPIEKAIEPKTCKEASSNTDAVLSEMGLNSI